jgi:WhiB family transcriptional regulator, redox-sensing transcriptional regulator
MTTRVELVDWGAAPTWLYEAEQRGITPACRGTALTTFFPPPGDGKKNAVRIANAKAICASGCPLYDTCRAWALAQPADKLYGVWGGTTRNERMSGQLGNRGQQPPQFRNANQRKKEAPA